MDEKGEETKTVKVAYFILETVKTPAGEYIPCIAVENEPGYHKTDWNYGTNRLQAMAAITDLNTRLGLSEREATIIQLSTMC